MTSSQRHRLIRRLLAAALCAGFASDSTAGEAAVPDRRFTPGQLRLRTPASSACEGTPALIGCGDDKAGTLREYGIAHTDGGNYEDDDLIPVCLGGDSHCRQLPHNASGLSKPVLASKRHYGTIRGLATHSASGSILTIISGDLRTPSRALRMFRRASTGRALPDLRAAIRGSAAFAFAIPRIG